MDKLGLEKDSLSIERAHRIGRRSHQGRLDTQSDEGQAQTKKDRPILVTFSSWKQKNNILIKARKELKQDTVKIKEDFSPDVRDLRRSLVPFIQTLKDQYVNSHVFLTYDKLCVQNNITGRKSFYKLDVNGELMRVYNFHQARP